MNAVRLPQTAADALTDRLGRALRDIRISVIDHCNFRCPYCMPAGSAQSSTSKSADWLLPSEIEAFASAAVTLGARKVRLTGGEPLLRPDLEEIVARLAAIPRLEDLALTTNGALLARRAASLRAAGLRRLNVSLDALDPAVFRVMSGGRGSVEAVLDGIEAASAAGFAAIRVNTVVQRGRNEDQVLALAEHFRGSGHTLRFIEYMDVGTCNSWQLGDVVTGAELRRTISARWPIERAPVARGDAVAERWRYVDGTGELGFVDSISQPFCGDCTRLRLGSDGRVHTCLFASTGTQFPVPLEHSHADEIGSALRSIWTHRGDRYSETRGGLHPQDDSRRIEMYLIGG